MAKVPFRRYDGAMEGEREEEERRGNKPGYKYLCPVCGKWVRQDRRRVLYGYDRRSMHGKCARKEASRKKRRYGTGHVYKQPGSRYWWIQWREGGVRHRQSSGSTDKGRAKRMLRRRINVARNSAR
jgi:hypothetical protein